MKFIDEDIKAEIKREFEGINTGLICALGAIFLGGIWVYTLEYLINLGAVANVFVVGLGTPITLYVWTIYYATKWDLEAKAKKLLEK